MEQSSDHIVSDEHFVLWWPENLPLDVGAQLLRAEIITYNPLRYLELDKPGMKIGVFGLDGLGLLCMLLRRWRKLLVQKLLFLALLLLRSRNQSKDLNLTISLLAKTKSRCSLYRVHLMASSTHCLQLIQLCHC